MVTEQQDNGKYTPNLWVAVCEYDHVVSRPFTLRGLAVSMAEWWDEFGACKHPHKVLPATRSGVGVIPQGWVRAPDGRSYRPPGPKAKRPRTPHRQGG